MLKLEQFWLYSDERAVEELSSTFCRSVLTITGSEIWHVAEKYGISLSNVASDDL